jgi:hypothetical protein
MNVGEALLALLVGFLFSFVGVQSSGHTDVNPVGTIAKVHLAPFMHPPKPLTSPLHRTGLPTHLRRHLQSRLPPPRTRANPEPDRGRDRGGHGGAGDGHGGGPQDGVPPARETARAVCGAGGGRCGERGGYDRVVCGVCGGESVYYVS